MKKLLLLALGCLFIFAYSCNKDKPAATSIELTGPKLLKIDRFSSSDSITYNEKGLPDTIFRMLTSPLRPPVLQGYQVLNYEQHKIAIKFYEVKDGATTMLTSDEVHYSPDGKFTSHMIHWVGPVPPNMPVTKDTSDFIYTNGKLTGVSFRVSKHKNNWAYNAQGNVYYPDTETQSSIDVTTRVHTVEYDNKPNFFGSSRIGEFLFCVTGQMDFQPEELLSVNNPLKSYFKITTVFHSNGEIEIGKVRHDFFHNYGPEGNVDFTGTKLYYATYDKYEQLKQVWSDTEDGRVYTFGK